MECVVDHYLVLGLPSGEEGPKLTEQQITKAYKRKALELHPDKRPDDPNAHENFQKLMKSYEILKDENARKTFDALTRAKRHQVRRQSQHDSWTKTKVDVDEINRAAEQRNRAAEQRRRAAEQSRRATEETRRAAEQRNHAAEQRSHAAEQSKREETRRAAEQRRHAAEQSRCAAEGTRHAAKQRKREGADACPPCLRARPLENKEVYARRLKEHIAKICQMLTGQKSTAFSPSEAEAVYDFLMGRRTTPFTFQR